MCDSSSFLCAGSESIDVIGKPKNYGVVEVFLKGKHIAADNEDKIVITENFAAVIDGATAKNDFKIDGQTTGKAAVRLISEAISLLPFDADVTTAVKAITQHIHTFYVEHGLLSRMADNPLLRCTASCVLFSSYRHEIWQIGDCSCLIGNEFCPEVKLIDRITADARAAYNQAILLRGATVDQLRADDEGRAFIMPLLRCQSQFQNRTSASSPFVYAVFDGFPVNRNQISVRNVSPNQSLVLASDGYPKVFPTWRETEDYLAQILSADPLCISEYRSTKGCLPNRLSFDDRAYLSLDITTAKV
jgi:hypothetical protein